MEAQTIGGTAGNLRDRLALAGEGVALLAAG
jgi:hypothetical protein